MRHKILSSASCARTRPESARFCQHQADSGLVQVHNGMFIGFFWDMHNIPWQFSPTDHTSTHQGLKLPFKKTQNDQSVSFPGSFSEWSQFSSAEILFRLENNPKWQDNFGTVLPTNYWRKGNDSVCLAGATGGIQAQSGLHTWGQISLRKFNPCRVYCGSSMILLPSSITNWYVIVPKNIIHNGLQDIRSSTPQS